MELNPLERVGAGSRVTFVICGAHSSARRAEQAELVSDLLRERLALDVSYYVGAIRKKCEPLLSALFAREEREAATLVSASGARVVVAPARQCDRDRLPGELVAARRLTAALDDARRARAAAEPPRERKRVDAFAALMAAAGAKRKKGMCI